MANDLIFPNVVFTPCFEVVQHEQNVTTYGYDVENCVLLGLVKSWSSQQRIVKICHEFVIK